MDLIGDLVLRDFPGPGCPVLCPLGLAIVFGWSCAEAVNGYSYGVFANICVSKAPSAK